MPAYTLEAPPKEVGETIPADCVHAVSVTLPTWDSNVAYEEGKEWVLSKLKTGYPRFKINELIAELARKCQERYANANEEAMLFPSRKIAESARTFILNSSQTPHQPHIVQLSFPPVTPPRSGVSTPTSAVHLFVLLYTPDQAPLAKSFWQHTGLGISSRMAEYCLIQLGSVAQLDDPSAESPHSNGWSKPLRRTPYKNRHYAKDVKFGKSSPPLPGRKESVSETDELTVDQLNYLEERYGRNLDVSFAGRAKIALRRRIAGTLRENVDINEALLKEGPVGRSKGGIDEGDVYLLPTGMSAIWLAHQLLLQSLPPRKSVCFGLTRRFTYVDTLKILQKWGPGCYFYGLATAGELDELEALLESGERVLGLFCEFPSNPLLVSPDLKRIRRLADRFDFAVVVDETIGNWINTDILDCADIAVNSLTKIFSGEANVMGGRYDPLTLKLTGSMVLNPHRKYHAKLKETMTTLYEDVFWPQDAVFMERNSRDFINRIHRVDLNAEAVCQILLASPRVKRIFYPKYNACRANYEAFRKPDGGYGGLLSVIFHDDADAVVFYDAIETAKGPSLGTNFTLTSPYTILAHYGELEWAARFGVERGLVRISVGLEETERIVGVFKSALEAIERGRGQ